MRRDAYQLAIESGEMARDAACRARSLPPPARQLGQALLPIAFVPP